MKNSKNLKAVGIIMALALISLAGCSDDKAKTKGKAMAEAVDTIATSVAHEFIDATFAKAEPVVEKIRPTRDVTDFDGINDLLVFDSVMYAVYDGGVVIFDFAVGEPVFIETGEAFNAVARFDNQVYVGGTRLYTVADNSLIPVEAKFEGVINELYPYGFILAIGTDCGLYSKSYVGDMTVTTDFAVVRMAADDDGLWVATDGQGLYRWNGEEFNRRYLYRDTTIFDKVRALDFNRGYLYVGTDDGFFISNGGSWRQLTAEDGLPSDWVMDIDASDWVILIGTNNGVTSYFNGEFQPVGNMESIPATAVERFGRRVLAGTGDRGILIKSGTQVKTLVDPQKTKEAPIAHNPETIQFGGE